ncbi:acyltransferase [Paenibacillus polymyxa]|uniref:acyltransferase family protein n=1 Tax=Paenibacillus polymyxa TaxID=1406 RepID=UPI00287FE437|nr:acyltransferase [Paenibacillus polymyxa]
MDSRKGSLLTLEKIYNRKNNSFDIVRFILAIVVIYSHSYILLLGPAHSADPIVKFTNNQISIATLAVNCFFVISGFLITQSLLSIGSFVKYLKNRILRIFPAFIFSVLLVAFVIGPLTTGLGIKGYLADENGSAYQFIFRNLTFNLFGYAWSIKDVFSAAPFPGAANGSIWTLKHEFALYLILPLCNLFLVLGIKRIMLFLSFFVSSLSVLNILFKYRFFNLLGDHYWVLSTNEYDNFIKLAPFFLFGSIFYLYKDKLIIHTRLVLLCIIVSLLALKAGLLNVFLIFTLPYIILTICVKYKTSQFRKYGDFSYGLYIYAFPIQQLMVYYFLDKLNVATFFIFSTIFTFLISFFSWHFIEKKALSFKGFKLRYYGKEA